MICVSVFIDSFLTASIVLCRTNVIIMHMKSSLSLRQHKIIQILNNNQGYMTSDEIAGILNVSSKTVRTDIADINYALACEGVFIDSVKSKGFFLQAQDPSVLKELSKDSRIFPDRPARVFYLAERLCTSVEPLDLYDLEDEMAVSSSTLTGDLTAFKNRFTHSSPFIGVNINSSLITLENDERKKRFILTKLLCDNWDYNSTGNTYYDSSIIDWDSFTVINSTVDEVLYRHNIYLDDYHLVWLNLYLAISAHQIQQGCVIRNYPDIEIPPTEDIISTCRDFTCELESRLGIRFPEIEVYETACIISVHYRLTGTELPDPSVYPQEYHDIARQYIRRVSDTFGIDFSDDGEFFIRLLIFISQLFFPMKDLTVRDTPDMIKQHLFVEYDIAILFHRIISSKCSIVEDDLLYLAWLISAAEYNHFILHPEDRFDTVVLTHMSIHSKWSLKLALQNLFGGYLNIKDVLSVSHKDYYDFSAVKLVLSTVNKQITLPEGMSVIRVSPYLSKTDIHTVSDNIRRLKIENIYPRKLRTVLCLLEDIYAHENMHFTSQFSLIEFMCRDFINDGIFTEEHMISILNHESISSFAFCPAILLLYSSIPAAKTKLSVLTLDHRIMWNKYKIRIVFMVSFAKEDMNELFYLQNALFHRRYDPDRLKGIHTIEELKEFYKDNK